MVVDWDLVLQVSPVVRGGGHGSGFGQEGG